MTRWLSSEEQGAWRLWLQVTARQMEAIDDDLQKDAGLALTDFEILVMLSEAPNRQLRMSELAKRVIVSRSRLTYRVDRLAERSLVTRRDFAGDRRGVLAELTDEGFERLERAAKGHSEKVRETMFDLISSDELETLTAVLLKMSAVCDPQD